jgi:predicted peptidase
MKRLTLLTVTVLSLFINQHVIAQMQTKQKTTIIRKTTLQYLLWLPADYKKVKHKTYPLLIFLHGSGERGDDLNLVKKWGPPSFVEQHPKFPFILLSPQCPNGRWWDIYELNRWLDKIIHKYRVDTTRIYLTGLSMGGFATWQWASAYPQRFAAIAPVCGGGDIQFADDISKVPVWAFHGQDDPVVPDKRTVEMVDAVNANGGHAKKTIYPGVGHNSWINAYNDQELYTWFLEHKK